MHEFVELQMSLLLAVALAGLIVGPRVFGRIAYTTFVANSAHPGAIVLLFVVSLKFRARELAAVRPFITTVAGIIVPWFAGYLAARGFGFETSRALVLMSLITTLVVPIVLRNWLYRT